MGKITTGATIAASATFGLTLIKLFQYFDFLKLINAETPTNFEAFLKLFESNIFDILPNFLDVDEEDLCNLHEILEENELSCLIVNNGGGILGQAFAWILFKLVIYLLCIYFIGKKYMPEKDEEKNKVIQQNQTIGEKFKRGFW